MTIRHPLLVFAGTAEGVVLTMLMVALKVGVLQVLGDEVHIGKDLWRCSTGGPSEGFGGDRADCQRTTTER